MSNTIPDLDVRVQAIDPTRSYICEAPAGSGKTELLTQRFLRLLSCISMPEEILAITFTRKATGEMRERVLTALHAAQLSAPTEPHKLVTWNLAQAVLQRDKTLGWNLLENPNRLQIKTFDSLCTSLARMMPFEAGFGALPLISDNVEQLYKQAIRNLFESIEDDFPWCKSLRYLLSAFDNRFDVLETLLLTMLSRREEWLSLMANQENRDEIRIVLQSTLNKVIFESLETVSELIPAELHEKLVTLIGFAADNLAKEGVISPLNHCVNLDLDNLDLPDGTVEHLPKWLGIAELLLTVKGDWRKSVNKKNGFPASGDKSFKALVKEKKLTLQAVIAQLSEVENLRSSLNGLRDLPEAFFSEQQWQILEALFDVLPVLVAMLSIQFKESHTVDFVEMSLAAQRALGHSDAPTKLALRMDYRLQHILVDEFQDTSSGQVKLINQLTAGWEPEDGRTLFCVGDAMQSIYGFRGANVGLFIRCRDEGLPNVRIEPLRLTANFRSQGAIVDWVNSTFSHSFPAKDDIGNGAVRYSPSHGVLTNTVEPAVAFYTYDEHSVDEEARKILAIIENTKQTAPTASIAILVSSRNHAVPILSLLIKNNISYRAVDMELLTHYSVVQDLLALTRALLHLADSVAWLALLRGPCCGLSLVDLEVVALYCKRDSLTIFDGCRKLASTSVEYKEQDDLFENTVGASRLTAQGEKRLKRIMPILVQAVENRDRKYFRSWIEGTWLALGAPAVIEEPNDLENAKVFFELLERWPFASELSSFTELEAAMEKLFALPDVSADDSLQVMTIHKSKGLEFDVVIIPSMHKASRHNDSELLIWHERLSRHGRREIIMAPLTVSENTTSSAYEYLRKESRKKQQYENGRLLYVACTRAKKQLHLFCKVDIDEDGKVQLPKRGGNSLISTIWGAVEHQAQLLPNTAHSVASDVKPEGDYSPPLLRRINCEWEMPLLPKTHVLDEYLLFHQFTDKENRVDITPQKNEARIFGTVVHRFIQKIANEAIEDWTPSKVSSLESALTAVFINMGVVKHKAKALTSRAASVLSGFVQSPALARLFPAGALFAKNEYPVTLQTGKDTLNLVIDRVVQSADGEILVVDYKTSEPEPDESLELFLAKETALYRDQLALYRRAMVQQGFTVVNTALYFPVIDEFSE